MSTHSELEKKIKRPDAFQRRGLQLISSLLTKKERLIPILVGVGIVAMIAVLWDYMATANAEKAWKAYQDAQKAESSQKWEALKKVAELGSSRASFLAAVQVGDHFFEEAKAESVNGSDQVVAKATEALQWYDRSYRFSGLQSVEKQLLLVNRGSAQELLGKKDLAQRDYEEASKMDGYAKGWALLNLGNLLEQAGDTAKAQEMYQKVISAEPDSNLAKTAKHFLRRLKSPLFNRSETVKNP